ncbi:MAG TPA: hypothetical protein EYM91_04015 [Acidobacteria bacterium]|nr:hypothetical protein [Acidobacteriota bacterium]
MGTPLHWDYINLIASVKHALNPYEQVTLDTAIETMGGSNRLDSELIGALKNIGINLVRTNRLESYLAKMKSDYAYR